MSDGILYVDEIQGSANNIIRVADGHELVVPGRIINLDYIQTTATQQTTTYLFDQGLDANPNTAALSGPGYFSTNLEIQYTQKRDNTDKMVFAYATCSHGVHGAGISVVDCFRIIKRNTDGSNVEEVTTNTSIAQWGGYYNTIRYDYQTVATNGAGMWTLKMRAPVGVYGLEANTGSAGDTKKYTFQIAKHSGNNNASNTNHVMVFNNYDYGVAYTNWLDQWTGTSFMYIFEVEREDTYDNS